MLRVFSILAALAASQPALAQLPDSLKGALGGPGGSTLPSVASASVGNVAGLLTFCVKNNYLSGGAIGAVQSALTGKLGGPAKQSHDPGFLQGSGGSLQSGGGQSFGLLGGGGGGLKDMVTHKVCELVLNRARSLL
jgi:hypothetical protein